MHCWGVYFCIRHVGKKIRSHLSIPCAYEEFYFPMCSNGTLTCKRNRIKTQRGTNTQTHIDTHPHTEPESCPIHSPVMWKFWIGHDGLWGPRTTRWQEPHGGAACSPSFPSLHEKLHEVTCYLKLYIKLRTRFDADYQEKHLQCQHRMILLLKDKQGFET